MRRLTLSLCGPTQVRLDGDAPPGAPLGAKPLALLAFLAVEGRAHSRDALTTLLWGEFPEAQARASLRQALAQLRRALGDVLVVEGDRVRLDAVLDLDVAPLLREPAAEGNGTQAAALALDPTQFLAGLRVSRDGGFEEWLEQTRAVLRRRHAAHLAHAARDAAARLDWAEAARLAERWREAEPLATEAVRLTMEAHHLAGRATRALEAFAEHRAALQAATGQAPAPALAELAARIRRAPAVPTPTPPFGVPAAQAAAASSAPLPLVGRRAEWDGLAAAWEAARAGAGRVAVVSGELGAGKSRLVADFARRAAADGGTVLRGRSREPSSGIPFATAAELLRSALDAPGFAAADGEWLAEVARLVPEVRTRLPGVPVAPRPAPAEEWRLYEGAVQLVAALAAEQPVCVLLDDVQWCDRESAGVVRMLVERTDALPVLWVVAHCTGQAAHEAPGVRLASALGALPQADSLPLAPLDADGMHALVVAAGGARDDAAVASLAARLHAATGGLPGYALEALRVLRAGGLLVPGEGGAWRPAGPLADDATLAVLLEAPTLAAAVRDRVQRLGEDGRSVLLTLTLAGAPCTPALLSGVHGISRLRAAAIGDALVERGLAHERDGAYEVASLLVAGMVRRLASEARRQEVQRALSAARGGQAATLPSSGAPARGTGEWRMQV